MNEVTRFAVGQVVRVSGTFTNATDGLVDPDTVTATAIFLDETGTETPTTYTYGVDVPLVRDALGTYHLDVSCTTPGDWYVSIDGSGTYAGAPDDDYHFVVHSRVTHP